ncbi:hypothetical protein DAI22_06g233503 [Oryza sativa Japonica Group]|nr:hypothetical protein DAI22_06g233503 [Oryza sativa Japonica Group]
MWLIVCTIILALIYDSRPPPRPHSHGRASKQPRASVGGGGTEENPLNTNLPVAAPPRHSDPNDPTDPKPPTHRARHGACFSTRGEHPKPQRRCAEAGVAPVDRGAGAAAPAPHPSSSPPSPQHKVPDLSVGSARSPHRTPPHPTTQRIPKPPTTELAAAAAPPPRGGSIPSRSVAARRKGVAPVDRGVPIPPPPHPSSSPPSPQTEGPRFDPSIHAMPCMMMHRPPQARRAASLSADLLGSASQLSAAVHRQRRPRDCRGEE